MGVWVVLDFLLLAAGAVALSLSIVWRAQNALVNMILSPADLTGGYPDLLTQRVTDLSVIAGTVLGVALLVTFAISVGAIVQENHVTIGLVILNYALLLDAIGIVIIGTFVWIFTLQEQLNLHRLWLQANPRIRIALQDEVCYHSHP